MRSDFSLSVEQDLPQKTACSAVARYSRLRPGRPRPSPDEASAGESEFNTTSMSETAHVIIPSMLSVAACPLTAFDLSQTRECRIVTVGGVCGLGIAWSSFSKPMLSRYPRCNGSCEIIACDVAHERTDYSKHTARNAVVAELLRPSRAGVIDHRSHNPSRQQDVRLVPALSYRFPGPLCTSA